MEPDLEARLRRSEEKRADIEKDYHDKLVKRDEEIEKLTKERDDAKEKAKVAVQKHQESTRKVQKLEDDLKNVTQVVEGLKSQLEMFKSSMQKDQEDIAWKDQEIEKQKRTRIQHFQDKKKAEKQLAEEIATNRGLHQKFDELEKKNADLTQERDHHAQNADFIHQLHNSLEETFTEFKGGNLSTPELIEKIKQRESTLQRSDSRTSMTSESDEKQAKKSRLSVGDELKQAGLFDEEESEGDEDGDDTLTEPAEVTEIRQKLQDTENDLADAKTKEGVYLTQIKEMSGKLEAKSKELDDSKKPAQQPEQLGFSTISSIATKPETPTTQKTKKPEKLGYSTITSVATEPIAPTPQPPKTTTKEVIREVIKHVPAKPTARDCWNAIPFWLHFLLLLFLLGLVYLCVETYLERNLWLGANSAARVATVTRLAGRAGRARFAAAAAGGGGYDVSRDYALGLRLLRDDMMEWGRGVFF